MRTALNGSSRGHERPGRDAWAGAKHHGRLLAKISPHAIEWQFVRLRTPRQGCLGRRQTPWKVARDIMSSAFQRRQHRALLSLR